MITEFYVILAVQEIHANATEKVAHKTIGNIVHLFHQICVFRR